METEKKDVWHVQEIIGGWMQNSAFSGTKGECDAFLNERCNSEGSWKIIHENDYKVDYL